MRDGDLGSLLCVVTGGLEAAMKEVGSAIGTFDPWFGESLSQPGNG